MDKKKCLIVLHNLSKSGAPQTFMHLVDTLSPYFDMDLIVCSALDEDNDLFYLQEYEKRVSKITVFSINIFDIKHKLLPFLYFNQFNRIIKTQGYDYAITNTMLVAAYFAKKKKYFSKIFFYSLGSIKPASKHIILNIVKKYVLSSIKKHCEVIGISDKCFCDMIPYHSENQLLVDYPDIDILFNPQIRDDTVIALGQIGYFCKLKNQMFSLRLLRNLKSNNVNCILKFIGFSFAYDSDYYREMMNFIQENELSDNVVFYPKDYDKNIFFSEIDCLLLPSLSEGLPLVTLESQYRQTPCIVSADLSEQLQLGGAFFKPLDVNCWSELISSKGYKLETLINVDLKQNFEKRVKEIFVKNPE